MGSQEFNVDALSDLFELEEAGSPGLIDELIADYARTSVTLRDALRAAGTANDVPLFERSAHSLKSSSRLLGLDQLADLAAGLEERARHGHLAVDEVQTLSVLLDAGLARLRDFRAERHAA